MRESGKIEEVGLLCAGQLSAAGTECLWRWQLCGQAQEMLTATQDGLLDTGLSNASNQYYITTSLRCRWIFSQNLSPLALGCWR